MIADSSMSLATAVAAIPEALLGRWLRGCEPRAGSATRSGAREARVRGGKLSPDGRRGAAILAVHDRVAVVSLGAPVNTVLFGSDPGGLPLDFEVISPPVQCRLSEVTPVEDLTAEVTYTPPASFTGQARFLYRAYDGAAGNGTRSAVIVPCPPASSELGQRAGARPLTVQARARALSGDPLPDAQYCWMFGDQEDCGDTASHGERVFTFTQEGVYVTVARLPESYACTPGRTRPGTQYTVHVRDSRKISGYVRDAASSPVAGVTLTPSGGLRTKVSNGNGAYTVYVPVGWSGALTLGGGTGSFDPPSRTYQNVQQEQSNPDYTNLPDSIPPPMGTLSVSPVAAASASGPRGGPFAPNSWTYTVANTGDAAISWSAAKTQHWLTLFRRGGTLAIGALDRQKHRCGAGVFAPSRRRRPRWVLNAFVISTGVRWVRRSASHSPPSTRTPRVAPARRQVRAPTSAAEIGDPGGTLDRHGVRVIVCMQEWYPSHFHTMEWSSCREPRFCGTSSQGRALDHAWSVSRQSLHPPELRPSRASHDRQGHDATETAGDMTNMG